MALVPLICDGGPVDDIIVREANGASDKDEGQSGSLRDLIDVGLIAREDEGGFNPFSDGDAVSPFVEALGSEPAPIVVGLVRIPLLATDF